MRKFIAGIGVWVALFIIVGTLYYVWDTVYLPQFVEMFKMYLLAVMWYAGLKRIEEKKAQETEISKTESLLDELL